MQERKILTLEEVLNLDRRPTLQEMVDLSIEDYTKYLYEKGIIKYIPESGNVDDYEYDGNYHPDDDIVVLLKYPGFGELEADLWYPTVEQLNETFEGEDVEECMIYVNDKGYKCDVWGDGVVTVYTKTSDGKDKIPSQCRIWF